jgi:2-polyprenyl-3-methyl-5-hydroxy-6-metoxy-1,4-benzoquinol methylase
MSILTERQQVQEEAYAFPYHYLDLSVDSYKYLLHIEYLSYLNIVKKLIEPFYGQFVLDAGCGDGRFCYQMRNENAKMVGTDYSPQAISFAKAFNPHAEFLTQDLKDLKLHYKFDYIVLIEILEHLIPEQIETILNNLLSMLKEKGKLIITVPSQNRPVTSKHYQHFSVQSLQETLQDYFVIEEVFGHSNIKSISYDLFEFYKKIAILMLPFRNRIKLIKKFYSYLQKYYIKYLETCDFEQAIRLIGVFRKKK